MSGINDLNKLRAFLKTLEMPKTFDAMPRNEAENTFKKLQVIYNLSKSFIDNYQRIGFNVKNDKLHDIVYSICDNIYHFFEEFNNPDVSMLPDFSKITYHYNQAIMGVYLFFSTDTEE